MIRVRELREAKGLQQKELAIDLGVSQPTISDWESGRKVPSAKSTQRVADYFGVTIDYLLGRDDTKKEPPAQGGELSTEIAELIRLFDLASPELQAAAIAVLKSAEAGEKSLDVGTTKK